MKPWSIEECKAYAQQLRDKTRANTAEDAAQAIEYLLGLVRREWEGLTDEELAEFSEAKLGSYDLCLEVEDKLKEKNAS